MSAQKKVIVFGGGAQGKVIAKTLGTVGDAAPGSLDLAVIPVIFEELASPTTLEKMTDAQWVALAEEPLRRVRTAIQAASALLRAPGGALVLIVPEIGMKGAADFTAQSMAAEGARALAKSVARAWVARGITVNSIAVATSQIRGEKDERARPGLESIAKLALIFADERACVTGTTLFADGGDMTSV